MLERIAHSNGVVTYQSPLLRGIGVPHAFTTRIGGLSKGHYATLNLGSLAKFIGDDNTAVAANFRKLRQAIDCPKHVRASVRQSHGRDVWCAPAHPVKPADSPEADSVIVQHPGVLALVRTADCVPVLLTSQDGQVVAAVHAGWRGVVAGVIEATLNKMTTACDKAPRHITAAIGPCISAAHFEVGREVAKQFDEVGLSAFVDHESHSRPHIDLPAAVKHQLIRHGVDERSIDVTDRCTYRDEDEFFSYRRDVTHRGQSGTGHMAAVVAANRIIHQEHLGL